MFPLTWFRPLRVNPGRTQILVAMKTVGAGVRRVKGFTSRATGHGEMNSPNLLDTVFKICGDRADTAGK